MHSEQGRAGKANHRGINVQCTLYTVGIFYALGTQGHIPVKFGVLVQPSISCLSNGSLVS